jgi:hypothetical protein
LISGSRAKRLAWSTCGMPREVDQIPELVRGESEPDRDGSLADGSLVAPELGSGPQQRREAALARDRPDERSRGGVGQQSQCAVEVRLARAVGAGDDGETREREDDVAQRPVARDGDGGEHAVILSAGSDAVSAADGRTGCRRPAGSGWVEA